ncbi:hypothetical protein M422DRAFT_253222 [Sphaerobolus stellatus SS14]|uniref:Uncharacterized protein n=1 Tax=Sphaerobolus stellatus (strain SS14) TaxID=990650 RepID=A0A0C9VYR1_SPHS4|nr:hypothetical protein M422DRAFT_253222 [Sphaerobolus stellatus SS14]
MSSIVNRVVTMLISTCSRVQEILCFKRGAYEELKDVNRPREKNVSVIEWGELLDPEDMAWQ